MSQTGYTPISLYYSATASSAPVAGNLVAGELALNTNDGKLFYKDSAGVVQTLATKAATAGTYSNITVTGGSINGTIIGATTASTGAFTTLSASSTVTLSGGTANGVAYLNGSKVVTTGSALTFDGTNLILGTGNRVLVGRSSSDVNNWGVQVTGASAYTNGVQLTYSGLGAAGIWVPAASALAFGADGASGTTELMRLTSTGLGIGESSPGTYGKLVVATATNGNGAVIKYNGAPDAVSGGALTFVNATNTSYVPMGRITGICTNGSASYNGVLTFSTANGGVEAEKMRLDSAGNLGLGVTPSAWSGFKAFDIGTTGAVTSYSSSADVQLDCNSYFNGSNWIYKTTSAASRFRLNANQHEWYTAPSGTAGSAITFTQAMTLDASGNLFLAQTSGGSGKLRVSGGSDAFNSPYAAPSAGYFFSSNSANANCVEIYQGRFDKAALVISGNNTGTITAVQFYDQGSAVGSITTTSTGTSYNIISDYRLKTVVGNVSNAGEHIDALQPVEYEWKIDGSRTRGFLAHQFQEVYKGSVVGEKDAVDAEGKPIYQAMQAGSPEVIADLVAEIQSLRKRLAAAGI